MSDPIQVTLIVIRVLDQLSIPYLIGGSMASSVHGMARATIDADVVADMRREHVQLFIEALHGDFYVSEEAMRAAVAQQSSFNLIHLESQFKVDIFVKRSNPFAESQFGRKRLEPMTPEPAQQAFVSSAEDTLLNKLVWYQRGDEVSDRQWNDVLGILKVQGSRLDLVYLKRWAAELGVTALLERARADAKAQVA